MTIATRLFTRLKGRLVGTDDQGNRYYTEHTPRPGRAPRRWVLYAGEPEASSVPPEWHAWLHWTVDTPLTEASRHPWQKPHRPNMTGTDKAWLPRGHDARPGPRPPATGDYEAWRPEG